MEDNASEPDTQDGRLIPHTPKDVEHESSSALLRASIGGPGVSDHFPVNTHAFLGVTPCLKADRPVQWHLIPLPNWSGTPKSHVCTTYPRPLISFVSIAFGHQLWHLSQL